MTSPSQLLARNLLGRAVGFQDCPSELLDEIVLHGTMHDYGKGDCVVHWNDKFHYLGVLVTGTLEAVRIRRDGQRHLMGLLLPGDFLGLVPIIDGLGQLHDVWTRSSSTVLFISEDLMLHLRKKSHALDLALQTYLAFRCRLLYELIAGDTGMPMLARMASLLQLLAKLHGVPNGFGMELAIKLSQNDFADWLGVSRQSINMTVKQLEAQGVVRLGYSSIHIIDMDKLVALAA